MALTFPLHILRIFTVAINAFSADEMCPSAKASFSPRLLFFSFFVKTDLFHPLITPVLISNIGFCALPAPLQVFIPFFDDKHGRKNSLDIFHISSCTLWMVKMWEAHMFLEQRFSSRILHHLVLIFLLTNTVRKTMLLLRKQFSFFLHFLPSAPYFLHLLFNTRIVAWIFNLSLKACRCVVSECFLSSSRFSHMVPSQRGCVSSAA